MNNAVRQTFRVQSAMSCNRFLFWIKKVPLIRRAFPDGFYAAWEAKQYLMVLVEILKTVYAFLGKFAYLGLACALPLLMDDLIFTDGAWPMFLNILFFMSFFVGVWVQSGVLNATLIKYTCVRQMGMNARACILATAGREHLTMFVSFTPALITAAVLFGQAWWLGLLLSLELAAMRLLAEAAYVGVYLKMGKLVFKNPWFVVWVVLLGMAAAYVPVLVPLAVPMDRILFHPAIAVVLVVGGLWAGLWLARYPGYRKLVYETCKPDTVSAAAVRQNAAQAAFKDVQMRESDLRVGDATGRVASLKGYQYLNAVFFRRHRRMLVKPVKYELIGVGAVLLAGLAAAALFPAETAEFMGVLPARFLPTLVFVMYVLSNTIGTRIAKAMFYNCDISLLRFGWYRERKVVLHNFAIRLGRITALNLLVGGAICLTVLAVSFASRAGAAPGLWPFLLCVLLLSVLFSVHPLFMYYAFQPYTAQLAVKNPFFTWINWGMYMVCVLCMQIHEPPRSFTLLVLAVTAAYIAAALLVVWKRAPKTFRVK